ncbi:hypothetical protein D9M73_205370 [compost metagenome]
MALGAFADLADAFLVALRFAVVRVVVGQRLERAIAIALEQGDGATVVRWDFQAYVGAVVFQGRFLRGFQELLAEADATGAGCQGDGVEAGQRGALVEQHQHVAEQAGFRLGDGQRGIGTGDHPLEIAPGQAVVLETVFFQLDQRADVIGLGGTQSKVHGNPLMVRRALPVD